MRPSHPSYAPDDAGVSVQSLDFLHSDAGRPLREAVAEVLSAGEPSVAQVAALRKQHAVDLVHAALALGRLQVKGRSKFPALSYVWASPEALEQSSSSQVAAWKAQRFAAAGASSILDFCAGIGGDAMTLAQIAPLTAIELSPVRARCLELNIEQLPPVAHKPTIVAADLVTLLPRLAKQQPNAFFHIDPARRWSAGGKIRRSVRFDDMIPGPDILGQIMTIFPAGALKLSPGVDFDTLPIDVQSHVELISESGSVVQAVLYVGQLVQGFPTGRTATLLNHNMAPFSYTATPERVNPPMELPLVGERTYLYEVDGAITRASLAAAFARTVFLTPLTVDGGYLFSSPGQGVVDHPALTAFELLSLIPFSEKRVIQVLQKLGTGAAGPMKPPIEVKTRGLPDVNTDVLQRTLTKAAPTGRTVLLFRHGHHVMAAITNRVRTPA